MVVVESEESVWNRLDTAAWQPVKETKKEIGKCLSISAPALIILFPVYWLLQTPGLFIIYL